MAQPTQPQKIQKYRISLSIPEMNAIVSALSKDVDNLLENAELVGWIKKQIRKAEFQVLEASHVSGPSPLTVKAQGLVEQVIGQKAKEAFTAYQTIGLALSEAEIILALQYKAEHPLECGTLEPEEQEVLNTELMKAFAPNL